MHPRRKMNDFAGHTKGPWRLCAEGDDDGGDGFLIWASDAASNGGYPVAEAKQFVSSVGRTKKACAANAALIAAAPMLLAQRDALAEALETSMLAMIAYRRMAEEACEQYGVHMHSVEAAEIAETTAAIDVARAALALLETEK